MDIQQIPLPRSPLADLIRRVGIKNHGVWVAGGASRRLYMGQGAIPTCAAMGDIDIFGASRTEADQAIRRVVSACDAFAAQIKVFQIVQSRYYASLAALFEDFDFTVTQFATDGESLFFTPEAARDVERNALVLASQTMNPRPIVTIGRIFKYATLYGFDPAPGLLSWALNPNKAQVGDGLTISFY